MSNLKGTVLRCPHCLHVLSDDNNKPLDLDPEDNFCPACRRNFTAAQALITTYPTARRKHP